ncbi:E3 ubiquitin-protein ligase [Trichinella pseudospiralis]
MSSDQCEQKVAESDSSSTTVLECANTATATAVNETTLRIVLTPPPRRHITWASGTVDNENLNRKKSKCCCIYSKPRKWEESSSESENESYLGVSITIHRRPLTNHIEFNKYFRSLDFTSHLLQSALVFRPWVSLLTRSGLRIKSLDEVKIVDRNVWLCLGIESSTATVSKLTSIFQYIGHWETLEMQASSKVFLKEVLQMLLIEFGTEKLVLVAYDDFAKETVGLFLSSRLITKQQISASQVLQLFSNLPSILESLEMWRIRAPPVSVQSHLVQPPAPWLFHHCDGGVSTVNFILGDICNTTLKSKHLTVHWMYDGVENILQLIFKLNAELHLCIMFSGMEAVDCHSWLFHYLFSMGTFEHLEFIYLNDQPDVEGLLNMAAENCLKLNDLIRSVIAAGILAFLNGEQNVSQVVYPVHCAKGVFDRLSTDETVASDFSISYSKGKV